MKYPWYRALLMLLVTIAAFGARADNSLQWQDAWVRAMPPGTTVAAAYGSVTNAGDAEITVVGVTSSLGDEAQMHDVIAEGDQRRMVQLNELTIGPGETLSFQPGGKHIMLMNVSEAPAEGTEVELCALSANDATDCTLAPVMRQAPMAHDGHGGHHH